MVPLDAWKGGAQSPTRTLPSDSLTPFVHLRNRLTTAIFVPRFGHRCRDTLITHQTSYLARLQYIHQNPVRHGLVRAAGEYLWSSVRWFETNAPEAFVKSVGRFKTDQVKVWDDFD